MQVVGDCVGLGSSLTDEQLVDVSFGLGVEETGQVGLSSRRTRLSSDARRCARLIAVVVLPTPPFRFVIVIVFIVSGF